MMIVKFAIVCGYFMHLQYDNPIFRRVFVFGLVLAVVVYLHRPHGHALLVRSYGT